MSARALPLAAPTTAPAAVVVVMSPDRPYFIPRAIREAEARRGRRLPHHAGVPAPRAVVGLQLRGPGDTGTKHDGVRELGIDRLVVHADRDGQPVGQRPGDRRVHVDRAQLGPDALVAPDPVGVVLRLEAEGHAHAEPEPDAFADRRDEVQVGDRGRAAGLAAVAACRDATAHRGRIRRGPGELRVELDEAAAEAHLEVLQPAHACRIEEHRGRILTERRGACERVADAAGTLLGQGKTARLCLPGPDGHGECERRHRPLRLERTNHDVLRSGASAPWSSGRPPEADPVLHCRGLRTVMRRLATTVCRTCGDAAGSLLQGPAGRGLPLPSTATYVSVASVTFTTWCGVPRSAKTSTFTVTDVRPTRSTSA